MYIYIWLYMYVVLYIRCVYNNHIVNLCRYTNSTFFWLLACFWPWTLSTRCKITLKHFRASQCGGNCATPSSCSIKDTSVTSVSIQAALPRGKTDRFLKQEHFQNHQKDGPVLKWKSCIWWYCGLLWAASFCFVSPWCLAPCVFKFWITLQPTAQTSLQLLPLIGIENRWT